MIARPDPNRIQNWVRYVLDRLCDLFTYTLGKVSSRYSRKPRSFDRLAFRKRKPASPIPTFSPRGHTEIPRRPSSITTRFPLILSDTSPEIFEVQKGSIRYILGRLGISYVPQLAIDIVKDVKQDAVSCFFEFLRVVDIDADDLLASGSVTERQRLEDVMGLLLEVDEVRREVFDVSPLPVYAALSQPFSRAELLLSRMKHVAATLRRLNDAKVTFRQHRMWLLEVREVLESWQSYDEEEVERLLEVARVRESQQVEFDSFIMQIARVADALRTSPGWERCRGEVEDRISEARVIEAALIENEAVDPLSEEIGIEQGLAVLAGLLSELHEIYKKFKGETFQSEDDLEKRLKKARELLGVSERSPIEEIRKVFRRLAMGCHPDHHPGYADAAKRFREVKDAYDMLVQYEEDNRVERYA